jgi:hypothetical protein
MQLPFVVADYLKGKTIYPAIRRFLNLFFSISVTSFVFEKFYFKYSWPDISNYKLLLDFFIKGQFIVPFCIFLLAHGLTYFVPSVIFAVYNLKKSIKWARKIVAYEITKTTIDNELRKFKVRLKSVANVNLTKETIIDTYLQFKDQLDVNALDEINKTCTIQKNNLESNFIFSFRALICIIIYFGTIPYFGWVLFTLSCIALLLYMFILIIGYQFLDVLPMAIKRFKYEADKYVSDHLRAMIPQGI